MITIEEANVVIHNLPMEFDSHDFINSYLTLFEREYVNMLLENIECESIFRIVNSKIGRFLVDNHSELNIDKDIRVNSPNVRGNMTDNQNWRKTR
jgi:hypothetical protein